MEPPVLLQRREGVAYVTLNRADKLNAINVGLRDALLAALAEIEADTDVHCVVLQAAGRAFSAGQDLDERAPILAGTPIDLGAALEAGINRLILAIAQLPQPVIAAVQGRAVGAGAGLALACDLMVAGPGASLHFSFSRLGLVPDSGSSWFLQRRLGPYRAAQALLLAEPIPAASARDMGLVAALSESDDTVSALAEAMAARIAKGSPEAIRATKALLREAAANDLASQLQAEARQQTRAGHSDAYRQALAGFLNRAR